MKVSDNKSITLNIADFSKSKLAEIASSNGEKIGKHQLRALLDIFATADIVWAVWQDAAEADGIGTLIAKGEGRLMLISQTTRGAEITYSAVPCRSAEEAYAYRAVFGDGRSQS